VGTRALFAGLIAASLIVPIRMVGERWRPHEVALALGAAVVTFLLTGLPPARDADPTLIVVAVAAAFAVCALVLPGVSGSYLLLTVGMYAPTLAAVNERNLAYLGAFIGGAAVGLGLFVSGLQWLLAHHRRIVLVIVTGLMAGSLRALWPWQGEQVDVLPPGADALAALGLFAIGAVLVLALIALETVLLRRRLLSPDIVSDPMPDNVHPEQDR
jgi:putative membrane protein